MFADRCDGEFDAAATFEGCEGFVERKIEDRFVWETLVEPMSELKEFRIGWKGSVVSEQWLLSAVGMEPETALVKNVCPRLNTKSAFVAPLVDRASPGVKIRKRVLEYPGKGTERRNLSPAEPTVGFQTDGGQIAEDFGRRK